MLPAGLTSLLDSVKNKAIAAAGPAAAALLLLLLLLLLLVVLLEVVQQQEQVPKRTLRHTETPCY